MATARLVFETPENLDDRTIAHAASHGAVYQVAVGDDLIATFGTDGITVRGLDCAVRWTAAYESEFVELGIAGDELVAVGHEHVDVWALGGEHHRRFPLDLEWEPVHVAIDAAAGQLAMIGPEAQAAVYDIRAAERVLSWDMPDDYDFGRWIEISAVMFRGGRLVVIVNQQITVWVDGELEQTEWRRGKNLGTYATAHWAQSDRYLMEVSSESRGLVVYDATSLSLLAQPDATGELCGEFGGRVFAWSDQHMSIWDGDDVRFMKTDWRGHGQPTFTPDGRHAVSLSLNGEICVQRVADFMPCDAEPPRMWAAVEVTAFAVNDSGTRACAVRGVRNTMSRVDVIDLATGERRELGKVLPTTRMYFMDETNVFATTDQHTSPVSVMTWSVDGDDIESTELTGAFMGSGRCWIATKEDDGRIVVRALENGALRDMATHELPKSWNIQSLLTPTYAAGYDDAYNYILINLDTRAQMMTQEGKVGGDLLVTSEWDQEYRLKARRLPSGEQLGEYLGAASEYVVLDGRRQVFFSTHEGELFSWTPPDVMESVFSAPEIGVGHMSLSSDERYLVTHAAAIHVFDTTNPRTPLLQLSRSGAACALVEGDHLLVGGLHGTYAVYAIEGHSE